MKQPLITKSVLALTLMLAVVAAAVGTFAYTEPTAAYPVNTTEPIDTSLVDQAKAGGLTVNAFFARGNADFKKDLSIDGVAQGGNPGDVLTTVQIASNVLATGDLYALDHLSARSLIHNEAQPKPVCGDVNGIVVFCPPPAAVIACSNYPAFGATVPPGFVKNPDGTCSAILRGTANLTCENSIYTQKFDLNTKTFIPFRYSRSARLTLTFDQPTLPNTQILFGGMSFGWNTNVAEGPDLPNRKVYGRSIMPEPFRSSPTGTAYTGQISDAPDPFVLTIPTGVTSYTVYPLNRRVYAADGSLANNVVYLCGELHNYWGAASNFGANPLDPINPTNMFFKLGTGTQYSSINFSSITAGATAHNINP